MFFSSGRLNRSIHLSGNAKIGKRKKTGIPSAVIIPDRLKQTYHSLLNQILRVDKENVENLEKMLEKELSAFEKEVLDLYMIGVVFDNKSRPYIS